MSKATKKAKPQKAAKPAKKAVSAKPAARSTAASSSAAPPKLIPRAAVRAPEKADELKARLGALSNATAQIRMLKRTLPKTFFEVGAQLLQIRDTRLFEAKGYGSFEAFVERELDLGKILSLRITRIAELFRKDTALPIGLDRLQAAVAAIDGETEQALGPARAPILPPRL